LIVASEPMLALSAAPRDGVSGRHACTHAVLVQIHFPFCSPLR
jgi:hypothetical protein